MSSSASSGTEHPVLVVVEIPKGFRNKYELDHETGRIRLDRMLFSPVHYPTDYGFVPDTLAEAGDPLDAMVLLGEPPFPGCEIQARIVGMLDMADDKGPDQKLLVVPLTDPHWNYIHQIDQVPPHLLREIEHFFAVYKQLEDKTVETFGWRDAYVGHVILDQAIQRDAGEGRQVEVDLLEHGALQVGPGEVGAVERGSLQVGPQLGAAVEVRLPQ